MSDRNINVRFYKDLRLNRKKTAEKGAPVRDEIELCELSFPGVKDRIPVYPAQAQTKWVNEFEEERRGTFAERFPKQYEAFLAAHEQDALGVRLDTVEWLSAARLRELGKFGVVTVEQLASLDGAALQRIGIDGGKLKEKAEQHLRILAEGAANRDIMSLQATIDELRGELRALKSGEVEMAVAEDDPAPVDGDVSREGDVFDKMTTGDLRAYLTSVGHTPPAKASKSDMLRTARELAVDARAQNEVQEAA